MDVFLKMVGNGWRYETLWNSWLRTYQPIRTLPARTALANCSETLMVYDRVLGTVVYLQTLLCFKFNSTLCQLFYLVSRTRVLTLESGCSLSNKIVIPFSFCINFNDEPYICLHEIIFLAKGGNCIVSLMVRR